MSDTLQEWLIFAAYTVPIGILLLVGWWFDFRRPVAYGLWGVFCAFLIVTFATEYNLGAGEWFGLLIFLGMVTWAVSDA